MKKKNKEKEMKKKKTLPDRPAEEDTQVQSVGRTKLLHNEKYEQPPPGEEHLSGTHQECLISAELPLPCQTADDNGNGNPIPIYGSSL